MVRLPRHPDQRHRPDGPRDVYERDHGGIVVPTRVERRKAQAARRDLERRCRKGGQPRGQARSTAARLHPRPPAKPARKRQPSPAGTTPEDGAQWRCLVERQAEQTRRQRTTEGNGWRAGDASGEATGRRGRRRGPPAPQPHPRRAVRRSELCVRTVLASASSCDAATAPSACPWRAAWAAPPLPSGCAAPPPSASWPGGLGATSTARRIAAGSTPTSPTRGAAGPSRPASASPKAERETKLRYKQAYAAWCFERDRLFSWSSDEKRRKLKAAFEASDAAYATYDRADKRLRRYERAVDAVERPRRAYHAPYSRSLEQVVAEADRRLAQERQRDNRRDHPMPRSDQPSPARVAETAPARPPASPPASRQRRPPTKPPSRTERPRTGPAIDMPDGVLPDNPETPPARAGRPSSRTWSAVHARPVTRSRSLPSHSIGGHGVAPAALAGRCGRID